MALAGLKLMICTSMYKEVLTHQRSNWYPNWVYLSAPVEVCVPVFQFYYPDPQNF